MSTTLDLRVVPVKIIAGVDQTRRRLRMLWRHWRLPYTLSRESTLEATGYVSREQASIFERFLI
jgi:hypothetical protein